MEPSATSTTVTGPVGERLQAGNEDAPVLDRPAPLRRLHDSGAAYAYIVVFNVPLDTLQVISETNINIQTSVLQIRLRIDIWGALQILFVLYCTYIHTYRQTYND